MSQQYGVPVGSSVNLMPGSSMPGSAGGSHAGPGPYSGPSMQYHPGLALKHEDTETVPRNWCHWEGVEPFYASLGHSGPAPHRSGSSPSYQGPKMPLQQYPPAGPANSQYYKVKPSLCV